MSFKRFYLAILAITAINYAMMLFYSVPLLTSAADGLWPFDARIFGYSVDEARTYVATITDEGRTFYLTTQAMLDFSFPAFYTFSLILTLYQLAPKYPALYLSPLAAAVFDYYENAAVTQILLNPVPDAGLVDMASMLTQLKYASIALSLLMVLGAWLWHKKRAKAAAP